MALRLQHSSVDRPCFITVGIGNPGAFPDPVDLADAFTGIFDSTFGAQIDDEVTIGPTTAYANYGTGVVVGVGSDQMAGGSNFDVMPPNNALLITKNTGFGGRKGRGRTFMPYTLPDAAVAQNGLIDTTSLGVRQAAADSWLAALEADDIPMVLLHSDSTTPYVVTSLSCQRLIAVQNKRIGRG